MKCGAIVVLWGRARRAGQMERQGYLILDSAHPLFAKAVATAIEDRARRVLDEVEKHYGISVPTVRLSIRTLATGGRKPTHVVRATFSRGTYPDVRFLFSEESISAHALETPFAKSDLLVLIQETSGNPGATISSYAGSATCKISVGRARAARLVEDLIVDISLGGFFRQSEPISTLVRSKGLSGLYASKAAFARQRVGESTGLSVARRAQYALLSSLGSADDQDVSGRATQAYEAWARLAASLSAHNLTPTNNRLESANQHRKSPFSRLAKIGGQLSMRRIGRATDALPEGYYTIVILRRGSKAGKSPAFRGSVRAIFGARPRINRFVIYAAQSYRPYWSHIENLTKVGHVAVLHFSKTFDGINFETRVVG